MLKLLEPYILSFIPIFVAVDAIGNIPLFVSLVEGLNKKQRDIIIVDSVKTAASVAILFMLGGKLVLRVLGISIPDFQIAGGVLLFVISARLLLPSSAKHILTDGHEKDVGVFPLGTPLITGPAVLTTTLIVLDSFGIIPTFVALTLNMLFVWLTLVKADTVMRLFGASGARAFSKIMFILLAAIGVMMIRKGILGAFIK
jgi:multiple antibiotic resistance protein